jgi:hypothetical protein
MSIDLTITARRDGTGDDDGMRVGELEEACRTLRNLGATSETALTVVPNRAHRVRTITATVPGYPTPTAPTGPGPAGD